MKSIAIALATLCLCFFIVYAFHATTPVTKDVKYILDTGKGQFPFTAQANSHMWDVYNLLRIARIITATLLLAALYNLKDKKARKYAGYILLATPIIIAAIPWQKTFTVFHQVFFPQGNWQFPANSFLIQTYPETFFITFALTWAGLCITTGALYLLSQKLPA